MRNMTSPVRSFNRRKLGLYSVLCILSGLTVLFAACDKKDDPTPEKNLYGDIARPAWTVPANPDPNFSMTAVIAVQKLEGVNIPDSVVSANDVLAAFSGETCLGIAKYEEGLFFLYIAQPTANSQELTANVTLRYWSAHYTNLFIAADAFPFVNDTQKGTPDTPFIPAFVVTK
jgi:hypothetical protein